MFFQGAPRARGPPTPRGCTTSNILLFSVISRYFRIFVFNAAYISDPEKIRVKLPDQDESHRVTEKRILTRAMDVWTFLVNVNIVIHDLEPLVCVLVIS